MSKFLVANRKLGGRKLLHFNRIVAGVRDTIPNPSNGENFSGDRNGTRIGKEEK